MTCDHTSIRRCVGDNCFDYLWRIVSRRFSLCDMFQATFVRVCRANWRSVPFTDDEPYWLSWSKMRLMEQGAFPCGCVMPMPVRLTVPLHCFSMYLVETEHHRERLAANESAATTLPALASTSRIFNTAVIPIPIDRIAARVSGMTRNHLV